MELAEIIDMIDSSKDGSGEPMGINDGDTSIKDYPVKGIPNLDFYRKTYARSCGENDDKAVRICKEYESADRNRKIKAELVAISQDKVSPILLEKIMGKVRPAKHASWVKWALFMLATFNSKRQ